MANRQKYLTLPKQKERKAKMDKIKMQEEIKNLEYAIFEIEMKDRLDSADYSLIAHYNQEIQMLKKELELQ